MSINYKYLTCFNNTDKKERKKSILFDQFIFFTIFLQTNFKLNYLRKNISTMSIFFLK